MFSTIIPASQIVARRACVMCSCWGMIVWPYGSVGLLDQNRLDRKDSEISPFTKAPAANARANIAPWDAEPSPMDQPSNYSGSVPAINRQPPSASPWTGNGDRSTPMPTSVFGSTFYNDSSDNLGQISPGFAPSSGMSFPEGDDRRPSVASATTVSSTGSKSSASGKFHKKLQGFFGDEYTGLKKQTSRQDSETSSVQGSNLPSIAPSVSNPRNRNNSVNASGPPSPSSSRPRSPAAPNNEVTPWEYQESQVRRTDPRGRHW